MTCMICHEACPGRKEEAGAELVRTIILLITVCIGSDTNNCISVQLAVLQLTSVSSIVIGVEMLGLLSPGIISESS